MAESSDQASVERRAAWIGLRTLRHRPKVVDRTARGEPVFEVRSVRLLLPSDAAHFVRLVSCAKCAREVPGAAVVTAAELDHPAHPVICKDCVRDAAATTSWRPEQRSREATGGRAQPTQPREKRAVAPARVGATEPRRVAGVKAAIEEVRAQVSALAEAQRLALPEMAQAAEHRRRELAEVSALLAETRSEIRRLAGGPPGSAVVEAVDRRAQEAELELRKELIALSDVLEAQRAELEESLDTRLRVLEERIDRLVSRAERVAHNGTSAPAPWSGGALVDALEEQLEAAEDRMARRRASAPTVGEPSEDTLQAAEPLGKR